MSFFNIFKSEEETSIPDPAYFQGTAFNNAGYQDIKNQYMNAVTSTSSGTNAYGMSIGYPGAFGPLNSQQPSSMHQVKMFEGPENETYTTEIECTENGYIVTVFKVNGYGQLRTRIKNVVVLEAADIGGVITGAIAQYKLTNESK